MAYIQIIGLNYQRDSDAWIPINGTPTQLAASGNTVIFRINSRTLDFNILDSITINGMNQAGRTAQQIVDYMNTYIYPSTSSAGGAAGNNYATTDWLASNASDIQAPAVGGLVTSQKKRFPAKTLAYFGTKADTQGALASLSDVSTTDAVYGTTALQFDQTGAGVNVNIAPAAVNTNAIDVTGGIIRFMFKPLLNINQLQVFSLELHSAGTPASPTGNYHAINQFNSPADIKDIATSLTGVGRWQGYAVAVPQFTVVGTGATLTAITFARLILRANSGQTVSMQIGKIEFLPNALTKAKCILSFDDGYLSQYTYALPQMSKYGFRGVMFPSPVISTVGVSPSNVTVTQLKHMHDEHGWQIGSQAWSTENQATIDAMTESQFTAELSKLRNWQNALGLSGGQHGSYFSGVDAKDLVAYATLRKTFRSIRAFGDGFNANPPLVYGLTFPWADDMNIRAVSGETSVWGANAGARMTALVDQAITNKGVAYFAWHNGLASAGNIRTGFDTLLAYLDANRATIDVITEDELYQ